MMPPITVLNHIHWVDRIEIKISPLIVKGESNHQLVKILFYPDSSNYGKFEVCAFTNHKEVQVEMLKKETKEKGLMILIEKLKESKNGRNNKKS